MNKTDIENMYNLIYEKADKAFEMPKSSSKTGADAAAKDLDKVEEYKDAGTEEGTPKPMKKQKDLKEDNNMIRSSFDSLFKNTLNEQNDMVEDEDIFGDAEDTEDMDMGGEEETTEEVDIATRLDMIINDLKSVVDELNGETEEEEPSEDFEEGMDMEEDMEEGYDMEDDETVEEAKSEPEPRPMANSSQKFMGKSNKVGGRPGASGGSANSGSIKNAPEPQSMGDAGGKKLMGKGSNKVSSSISSGRDLY